ncbi:hypothetical protein KC853_02820 [Candidatus Saccharibacteria bacterium]|nr:hypothetical protein [Candidatus Saccharibacteria bacterium]MCB9834818.1 hypothetical protein [Candidatus Nomurabacteria bacterium]
MERLSLKEVLIDGLSIGIITSFVLNVIRIIIEWIATWEFSSINIFSISLWSLIASISGSLLIFVLSRLFIRYIWRFNLIFFLAFVIAIATVILGEYSSDYKIFLAVILVVGTWLIQSLFTRLYRTN